MLTNNEEVYNTNSGRDPFKVSSKGIRTAIMTQRTGLARELRLISGCYVDRVRPNITMGRRRGRRKRATAMVRLRPISPDVRIGPCFPLPAFRSPRPEVFPNLAAPPSSTPPQRSGRRQPALRPEEQPSGPR